jgi:hypothetical protein
MIYLAYGGLIVAGLLFTCVPFVGEVRRFPRWIRIALLMFGLSFLSGGILSGSLEFARLSGAMPQRMYYLLLFHEHMIFGIGVGNLLLLIFSGEIFKALRAAGERWQSKQ